MENSTHTTILHIQKLNTEVRLSYTH